MFFLSSYRIDAATFTGITYKCNQCDICQYKPAYQSDKSQCAPTIIKRNKKG